jgi:WD40 repeat protein
VVFVLSPASAASETCVLEVEHAAGHHKRLIPVVVRDVDPKSVPPTVGKYQWLSFRAQDDLDNSVAELLRTFDTDLDRVRAHTRLLGRALEWQSRGRDSSLLLRGNDLKSGEAWLLDGATKEPSPTQSQHEYVATSRRAANVRQRSLIGSLITGLIITVVLAIAAWVQRQEAVAQRDQAERQRKRALGRQLAAQSEVLRTQSPNLLDRSSLLAIEAAHRAGGVEVDRALREAVGLLPSLVFEYTGKEPIQAVSLSPLGNWAAAGGDDSVVHVWDTAGKEIARIEHGAPVKDVAFSPDGKHLASASMNGVVVLEPESGRKIRLKRSGATLLAFGGELLASGGGDDGRITLSDVAHQRAVRTFRLNDAARALALSADGRLLAAGAGDAVYVWEAATGRQLMRGPHRAASPSMPLRLGSRDGGVFAVAFHPAGFHVVSGAQDHAVRVWDIGSGREEFRGYQSDAVYSVDISPDRHWLASGGMDETARVWNLQDGSERYRLQHQYVVQKVQWTSDGSLLTVSGDGTARIWSMATGRELSRMYHSGYVFDAAVSPSGSRAITGDWDGSVRVWELGGGGGGAILGLAHEGARRARYSPDGTHVITIGETNFAQLWAVPGGKPVHRFQHEPFASEAAFSPDGRIVVTAGWDGLAHLWDVASGERLASMRHEGRVGEARFSPDGRLVVTGGVEDGTAGVWEVKTGRELLRLRHDGVVERLRRMFPNGGVRSISFTPDGRVLATGGQDGTVRLWDLQNGREIRRLTHRGFVTNALFTPEGRYLITDSDQDIYLWSMPGGEQIAHIDKEVAGDPFMEVLGIRDDGGLVLVRSFEENSVQIRSIPDLKIAAKLLHEDDVFSAAFNRDGSRLLTASRDKTARVWDTSTWQEVTRVSANDFMYSASYSPDERFFMTASGDGFARIWAADVDAMVEMACRRLRRNLTLDEWRQHLGSETYAPTCPR